MNKHHRDEASMKMSHKKKASCMPKMSDGGSVDGTSKLDSIMRSGKNITNMNASTNKESGLGIKKSKIETLKMAAGGVAKVRKGQY